MPMTISVRNGSLSARVHIHSYWRFFVPHRHVVAVALAATLVAPAVALADGPPPPHTNIYMQHRSTAKPIDNVIIELHRNTSRALVQVDNFCLGSTSYPGAPREPDPAVLSSMPAHHGKLSYRGPVMVYTSAHGGRKVRMVLSAVAGPTKAQDRELEWVAGKSPAGSPSRREQVRRRSRRSLRSSPRHARRRRRQSPTRRLPTAPRDRRLASGSALGLSSS